MVLARRSSGSALILTIMMVVMLTLELAVVSLISMRGFGEEGLLFSQNTVAKRSAENAINKLVETLYAELGMSTAAEVADDYDRASSPLVNQAVQTVNPDNGAVENTGVTTDAWIAERRGNYFHLVGRAVNGGVDLMVHRWVKIKPCSEGPTGLITIVSGVDQPGRGSPSGTRAAAVSPVDGRVFFGQEGSPGSFWTWKNNVLSTLVTGESYPGLDSTYVGPDGRVFFGEDANPGSYWTWKEGVGLSTLVNAEGEPGLGRGFRTSKTALADDGRIFFGETVWGSAANFWTWKESTGLSTILTGADAPGRWGSVSVQPDGRVFFAEASLTNARVWTWKDNGTAAGDLIVVLTTGKLPGRQHAITAHNGRVFFGENANPGRIWTWQVGDAAGGAVSIVPSSVNPGSYNLMVDSGGRFFFGNQANPGHYWTWKSGVLTTLLNATGNQPGSWGSSALSPSDRAFFIKRPGIMTWKQSTGLSTITTVDLGFEALEVLPSASADQVFFSSWGSQGVFTWRDNGTAAGLYSTIITGINATSNMVISPEGRLFFGHRNASGNYYTWKEGVGLSTLLTGRPQPGLYFSGVIAPDGRVYFGEDDPAGNYYTWKDPNSGCGGGNF